MSVHLMTIHAHSFVTGESVTFTFADRLPRTPAEMVDHIAWHAGEADIDPAMRTMTERVEQRRLALERAHRCLANGAATK